VTFANVKIIALFLTTAAISDIIGFTQKLRHFPALNKNRQ